MSFTPILAAKGQETEDLAELVADRIWPGRGKGFGVCRAIAVVRDSDLAAGLIYHNYDSDAGAVEISGAAWLKGWMTRPVLKAMYDYPFVSVGCNAVVHRVCDEDTAQHRMLKIYGAKHYRIPDLRGRGKAENIFVITRDAWAANKFNRGR